LLTNFRPSQLSGRDGQCVQDFDSYSPKRSDFRLLSDSYFKTPNFRSLSELRKYLKICLILWRIYLAPFCYFHCGTFVAQLKQAVLTLRRPLYITEFPEYVQSLSTTHTWNYKLSYIFVGYVCSLKLINISWHKLTTAMQHHLNKIFSNFLRVGKVLCGSSY